MSPRLGPLALGGVACFAVAQALVDGNSPFLCLAFAIVAGAAAVFAPRVEPLEKLGERGVAVLLWAFALWNVGQLFMRPPGIYLRISMADYFDFLRLLGTAAVLVGAGLWREGWAGRLRFPALLAVFVAIGFWTVRHSPQPHIDVFYFHQAAFEAIRAHHDPWGTTIPNIYGNSLFYGPGLVENGRVMVGHPYPPLSLAITFAADAIAGDYRYALVIAIAGAAALFAYARPGRLAELGAALFLFMPRVFFVIEQGWTDSLAVFFLALVVFCACRYRRALPIALGLLFAVKQYLLAAAPLALLLLDRPWRVRDVLRLAVPSGAIALVLLGAPFLFSGRPYFHSVIEFQVLQPFRIDALSFLAFAAQHGIHVWEGISFVLLLGVLALCVWRAATGPASFALTTGFAFLVFFATSKQAFVNYYAFVLGALVCGLCAALPIEEPKPAVEPAPAPAPLAG
jgi:hypothetical protein